MYDCKIKEFGTQNNFAVVSDALIYQDNYAIYDCNYCPVFLLPNEFYSIWHAQDEIWIGISARNGVVTSSRISCKTWNFDHVKQHRYDAHVAQMCNYIFVIEGRRDDTRIVAYDLASNLLAQFASKYLYSTVVGYKGFVYASDRNGGIFCLNDRLKKIWSIESNKLLFSPNLYIGTPICFNDLIIFNLGCDDTPERRNFEINAYRYDTGELVWQRVVETTPTTSNLIGDKLYVCVNNRFRKIDAETGNVDLDIEFDYKTFNGEVGRVSGVYPVDGGLLCFNPDGHNFELRSCDATQVLQTIKLPETYCASGEGLPLLYENKLYIGLGHLIMWLNPMKSAIAVLTPDENAPAFCSAQLEERPPHSIEKFKDQNGKNALRLRIGGDDANKAFRYAHVILKELAYLAGVSRMESEDRDKKNAGTMELVVDISQFPVGKTPEQWLDFFGDVKKRAESEFKINKVFAGDGKSEYKISVSVV